MPISTEVEVNLSLKDDFSGPAEKIFENFQKQADLSSRFGNSLGATFDKLIYQGRGFESVLFDLQRELSRLAIRAAASGIFNKVFGGIGDGVGSLPIESLLPGFANGGRINAFQTAIVGERGPELFKPAVSGDIVPNDRLNAGTSIVNNFHFNVDAPTYMANQGQISADIARAIERGRRNH